MANRKLKYKGKDQSISWDGRLCIHVGECGRAKGDLFVGGRKPWCDPDLSSVDDASHVVKACPTGALSQQMANGEAVEEPKAAENSVLVSNDGPLYLCGNLNVSAADGTMPSVKRRAALCRCGASKNKPFCDGAHREAGFKDGGAVGERGMALEEVGGELSIKDFDDGPLEFSGNFSIQAGSGRPAWQGKKAYLCRCGASKNKPFCDGMHKQIGFKTEE